MKPAATIPTKDFDLARITSRTCRHTKRSRRNTVAAELHAHRVRSNVRRGVRNHVRSVSVVLNLRVDIICLRILESDKRTSATISTVLKICKCVWRRGSVVRTSVFGWLIYAWSMVDMWTLRGKVSAMGQPTRPTQPSIRSASVKWVVIHMDYGGGDQTADHGCVWLFVVCRNPMAVGFAHGL